MELYSFDDEYVLRLCQGDREAEEHFFRYFCDVLFIKLRRRVRTLDGIEDITQETLLRALRTICSDERLRDSRKLGSFVNSICGNVLMERFRKSGKSEAPLDDYPSIADQRDSAEKRLMRVQERQRVHRVLDLLDPRDSAILKAIFIEERDYLRVLLFRAKEKFRVVYELQPR